MSRQYYFLCPTLKQQSSPNTQNFYRDVLQSIKFKSVCDSSRQVRSHVQSPINNYHCAITGCESAKSAFVTTSTEGRCFFAEYSRFSFAIHLHNLIWILTQRAAIIINVQLKTLTQPGQLSHHDNNYPGRTVDVSDCCLPRRSLPSRDQLIASNVFHSLCVAPFEKQ